MDFIALVCLFLGMAASSPLSRTADGNGTTVGGVHLDLLRVLDKRIRGSLHSRQNGSDSSRPSANDRGVLDFEDLTKETGGLFPTNQSVDYDSMDLPKPERLVPDADSDADKFPNNVFEFKQMHERAQYMRIEEVKQSLLDKLRLIAPPNVTALKMRNKLSVYPTHILPDITGNNDVQSDDAPDDSDEEHAKISTIIEFATVFPEEKGPENFPVADIAYFAIPTTVSSRNLERATLMVYVGTPDGAQGSVVELCVASSRHKEKPLLVRDVTLSGRGHWEHLDVSEQVREWVADDDENLGLIVTAELNGVNLVHHREGAHHLPADDEETVAGDVRKRPYRAPLVKMSLNGEAGRRKRSFDDVPLSCSVDDQEKRCCRYKFVIDFELMGPEFDFIIQPKRYLANYCAGACPTYYMPNNLNSRLLAGLSGHKLQRCCTPAKLKPLEIIYIDDNGSVVTGLLPNMTIEKCTCS